MENINLPDHGNALLNRGRSGDLPQVEGKSELQVLFESLTQGVVYQAADGRIINANPAAEEILGLSLDQIKGLAPRDFSWRVVYEDGSDFPDESQPGMVALRTGKEVRNVVLGVYIPAAKQYRWINTCAVPQFKPGDEKPYQAFTTFDDITGRKIAEEALRKSEWRNRKVSEMMTDYIFIVDVDGAGSLKLSWASESMTLLTGRTISDAATMNMWQDIIHPDDAPAFFGFIQKILTGGKPGSLECRTFIKSGEERWIQINANPQVENDGVVVSIVGAIKDVSERKRAEESLVLMTSALNIVQDEVFLVDETGRFQYVNEGACKALGYSREELLGMLASDIDIEFNPEARTDHWRELKSRRSLALESRYKTRDGRIYPVEISANYIEFLGHSYNLALVRDITERKHSEEILHRLNRELQAINSCSQVMLRAENEQVLLNEICRIICDEAGYRMAWVGYAENDHDKTVRPTTWAGFEDGYLTHASITWADDEQGRGPTGTAIRKGEIICVQDFNTDPNMIPWRENAMRRGYLSSIALPLMDQNGSTIGALTIYSSETNAFTPAEIDLLEKLAADMAFGVNALRTRLELEKAGQALRDSEAALKKSQAAAHLGHWSWDTLSNQVVWSDEMYRIFGYEPGGVFMDLNEVISRAIHPDDQAKVMQSNEDVIKKQKPAPMEYRVVWPDGSVHTVWAQPGERIVDEKGSILQLNGIVQDITGRKLAEEEKDRLQAQLLQSQKMETVGRLAGGVAHDFNNLLGVIIGHAEKAIPAALPTPSLLNDLQAILNASKRSSDLVRQLLAFARKQAAAPRVLDLNDVIAGMLNMLQRLIGEDIDLAWLPGYDLLQVNIDPSQLDQVMANLVVNARDAIRGVGRISIETDNIHITAGDSARFAGADPGDYVRIAITDNGCGMDPETLSHLFEPFFTTKVVGKGTGLGLATVYGIVKQNSGTISVSSEPAQGTTFRIYLPRAKVNEAPPREKVGGQAVKGGGETILIVEDEEALLDLGGGALGDLGYKVLAAGTPAEAVRLTKEQNSPIDLLITDVIMPEMNGRKLAEVIKTLQPGIKILFMSGYTADIIADHGVLEENVAFIQKPFGLAELAARVRQVLG